MNKPSQFVAGTILGAVGILGMKSYFQFRQDLQIADQRVKEHGRIIETRYGRIVYGTHGEGPPVLVIHGAGGGFDQALHTAKMFGQGFQWIAPSRFGYLGTSLSQRYFARSPSRCSCCLTGCSRNRTCSNNWFIGWRAFILTICFAPPGALYRIGDGFRHQQGYD